MQSSLSSAAEHAFATTLARTLSSQPVVFPSDYQQAPELTSTRPSVLHVPVPPPPTGCQPARTAQAQSCITLTFKSLKPSASFDLAVNLTDSVATVKTHLAALPGGPPVDAQRLLFKGKALADERLLKEYPIQDGDTVNLMTKPGVSWGASGAAIAEQPSLSLHPDDTATSTPRKHQRIPSVVLSPSPNRTPGGVEKDRDIRITLDTLPTTQAEISSFHNIVSDPIFWSDMYNFLRSKFASESDAQQAFEDYLCASKGSLTPSEIAKIRDFVGVVGMAGT